MNLPPDRATTAALWQSLSFVESLLLTHYPTTKTVLVRIVLNRWTWMTLGVLHYTMRNRARLLLDSTYPSDYSITIHIA